MKGGDSEGVFYQLSFTISIPNKDHQVLVSHIQLKNIIFRIQFDVSPVPVFALGRKNIHISGIGVCTGGG